MHVYAHIYDRHILYVWICIQLFTHEFKDITHVTDMYVYICMHMTLYMGICVNLFMYTNL